VRRVLFPSQETEREEALPEEEEGAEGEDVS